MLLNIALFSGFRQSSVQSLSLCRAVCRSDRPTELAAAKATAG